MKTKRLVLMALLVGIGTALYFIIPGYGDGMKPDIMLTMMFIGILLFPSFKDVFLLSVVTGVLSGLFSTFPGGFVPNIIEKIITGFIFFGMVLILKKFSRNIIIGTILVAIGTLISGTVFLSLVILIFNGLPGGAAFAALFTIVVLPTTVLDAISFVIIYPIITGLMKRYKFETANI